MTIWEFACMTEGFSEANRNDQAPEMGADRLADLGIEGF